jgi:hypothetical protein
MINSKMGSSNMDRHKMGRARVPAHPRRFSRHQLP